MKCYETDGETDNATITTSRMIPPCVPGKGYHATPFIQSRCVMCILKLRQQWKKLSEYKEWKC